MVNPRSIRQLVALAAAIAVIGGIGVAPAMALAGWGGDARPTTTTSVFLDSADLEYGTEVTGEVTVVTDLESGGDGKDQPCPTGQVELSVDGGPAVAETLEDGLLRFDLGEQTPGSHTVTAEFPGDDQYVSSSDVAGFTVTQVPSSITVTDTPELTFGTASSVTVQVNTNPEADPTGEVTLTDRGEVIGTGPVTVESGGSGLGTATLELPATLEPGTHNVVLAYSGDDLVEPSESEPSDVEVDRAPASVTVSPEPAELVVGQKQALVVEVGAVAGHVAEGTVRVDTDGADLGTVDLVDGSGSLDLAAPLPAGSTAVYVTYSGDDFLAASDDTARLTVTATPGATGGTPATTPVPATPGATGASPVAAPVRAATPARAHGLAGAVLAATGANVQDLVVLAIALLGLGGAATVFTRRRAGRSARRSSHRAA